jgi:hypothetical protein
MENPPQPASTAQALSAPVFWLLFTIIAAGGVIIRLADTASFRRTGFDETIYRRYVYLMDGGKQEFSVPTTDGRRNVYGVTIDGTGAAAMPQLCALFLETQKKDKAACELPPTRFLYTYTSWIWKNLRFGNAPPLSLDELMRESMKRDEKSAEYTDYSKDISRRDPALAALNNVACGFSMLLMIAGGLFAWRMGGRGAGLAVLALMAADPLQIHLSQHAMIDGFMAFWALMCLWTTWECLQHPKSVGWLIGHAVCLALMVMTKENSFFVYCALGAVVLANRWLKFGTVTPAFLLTSVVGPLLGVAALVTMAGGVTTFIDIYKMLVLKAQDLDYAQMTGDGPWYRYLVDLMIMSPIVLCLSLGAFFVLSGRRRDLLFLVIFVAASYLIMCNVRYGMNLRYSGIWGMPMRFAAFLMIWELCARFRNWQWLAAAVLTIGLCVYEVRQYGVIVMGNSRRVPDRKLPFYEVVTADMLRQTNILKDQNDIVREPRTEGPKPADQ